MNYQKTQNTMIAQNKRLIALVLTVAAILSIPLIAMQFTNEVAWTASDFGIAAVLLLGTGLLGDLVLSTVKRVEYQIGLCLVLLLMLALIWIELAVGLFGTPFAGS